MSASAPAISEATIHSPTAAPTFAKPPKRKLTWMAAACVFVLGGGYLAASSLGSSSDADDLTAKGGAETKLFDPMQDMNRSAPPVATYEADTGAVVMDTRPPEVMAGDNATAPGPQDAAPTTTQRLESLLAESPTSASPLVPVTHVMPTAPVAAALVAAAPAPAPVVEPAAAPTLTEVYREIRVGSQGIEKVIENQGAQNVQLTRIENSVNAVAEKLTALNGTGPQDMAKAKSAAPTPDQQVAKVVKRKAVAKPRSQAKPKTEAAPIPEETTAQLLSVDMWGGVPSVVFGTGQGADRRVVFMSEGEQNKRIRLKSADPVNQTAVLDVAGREVRLSLEQ